MKATLLLDERHVIADDAFVEIVVWRVPRPVRGAEHPFKYRLAFVIAGECVLRYDNEAGKGDHRHVAGGEAPYAFAGFEHLLSDFWEEVEIVEAAKMKIVTLEVASVADVKRRALDAFKGKRQNARISFGSPELLWKILTAKRWELLKAMAGGGAMTIREAARRVGRDVKAVHGDVHVMLDCGLLDRTEKGRIEFRFDAVHVDFTLRAA